MKLYILLTILFITGIVNGQVLQNYPKHMDPNDSIMLVNLPKLTLPDHYKSKSKNLPDYHDNSIAPYFRPIFSQYGWSCGQASSIGYSFTYELNHARNESADEPENQYPPLFAFNFFNKGEDGIGVSYQHTLDAIKHNGTPNVIDYGGMGESLTYWPDGYDKYYNGMFNRVDQVFAIDVGEEEGLLTLKQYLYDHLDGSDFGGVVNFYTDLWDFTSLPAGTPEEGKAVITAFGSYTGHAMTFIGWNDSVRWDYNQDGQYTNDLDINDDGEVNMKDWEIGGMILANSWGDDWADDGFCYVMYNVLAMEKLDGGIWNKQVHVISVKEDYAPQITFKVELTHGSRDKLKIFAGVSSDTLLTFPEHMLELPVFEFQGGDNYMQGDNSANEFKTIEIGLDVTPLLSYVQPGEPARFFLQIQENDPGHLSSGQIDGFSLMDYTIGEVEVVCPDVNVPINENNITLLSAVHSVIWNDVSIVEEEIPPFVEDQEYSTQFSAIGGMEPYKWSLVPSYLGSHYAEAYSPTNGEELIPNDNYWGHVVQQIKFPFPFYDKISDTVYMHVDGFLSFDKIVYPLPYQVSDLNVFKNVPVVAAFMNQEMVRNTASGNKMYYSGDESHASFRWETQIIVDGVYCPVDITVKLFPDGTIEVYHDTFIFPEQTGRITGVSNGDAVNYFLATESFASHSFIEEKYDLVPQNYPADIHISDTGLLVIDSLDADKIYNISVRVTDDQNISELRSYQLSTGLTYSSILSSGGDEQIDYGEITFLSFSIKNINDLPYDNLQIMAETDDPFLEWIVDEVDVGLINPGETILLDSVLSFSMDASYPDQHNINLELVLLTTDETWQSRINLEAFAPEITTGTPIVLDDNGHLDPGETRDVVIPIHNTGHSHAQNVNSLFSTEDIYIDINQSSGNLNYGNIPGGSIAYDTVNLTVHEDTPGGHTAQFLHTIQMDPDIELVDTIHMLLGRYPVFVADLDPELLSGPIIKSTLEELDINHFYHYYLPENLDAFENIFVVLGRNFGQHILTENEGQKLADYLNAGGNVYMEGGLTWYDDPQTAVHPMFHLETQYLGWKQIDSVYGAPGSFLDEMHFDYIGESMYYNYHVLPTDSSFTILGANQDNHFYAVAFEGENYKTVGSTLDFGAFIDGPTPSRKDHLLAAILEFFGVEVIISDITDRPQKGNQLDLNVTPNPIAEDFSISFNLQKDEVVSLLIHDISGNQVYNAIKKEYRLADKHKIDVNGNSLEAGVYFCTLQTTSSRQTIKIIKTK